MDLVETVAFLSARYVRPHWPTDPFELILWENIGYLIDDERRRRLFDLFRHSVGLSVAQIEQAEDRILLPIAQQGGMRPDMRVARWRRIASIIIRDCDGDLNSALRSVPLAKARSILQRFPTIGEPGADKVLLFSGIYPQPALDSNGLRVLARMGWINEQSSYSATYNIAVDLLTREGIQTGDWMVGAYHVLREHGKTLCKRGQPLCIACAFDDWCAHRPVRTL